MPLFPHVNHSLLFYLLNANLGLTPKPLREFWRGIQDRIGLFIQQPLCSMSDLGTVLGTKGKENHNPSSWSYSHAILVQRNETLNPRFTAFYPIHSGSSVCELKWNKWAVDSLHSAPFIHYIHRFVWMMELVILFNLFSLPSCPLHSSSLPPHPSVSHKHT